VDHQVRERFALERRGEVVAVGATDSEDVCGVARGVLIPFLLGLLFAGVDLSVFGEAVAHRIFWVV
jgi:hypothetical protein